MPRTSPVAQWREEAGGKGGGGGLTFLATDHLGTPACALAGDASVTWSGGFEPFGRDWQHGTPEGALASGLFLRLPGQWDHPYWHRDLRTEGFGADLFYNVHRWYEAGTGRYIAADPLISLFPARSGAAASGILMGSLGAVARGRGVESEGHLYVYAMSNPLGLIDAHGLAACPPMGDPACAAPGSGCCVQACIANARWALCMAKGAGFFGDLASATTVGVAAGVLGGPTCGFVIGAISLTASMALDHFGNAATAGTKAVFDNCYRNCGPVCPTFGCNPDDIFRGIASGGM